MVRGRTRVFLALAAVVVLAGGVIAGGVIAGGATAGGATAGGAPHGGATSRATVPTIVLTTPSTCFVAGQACSIHPCVEFVAPRPPVAQPQPSFRARAACAMHPSPRGQVVRIRR